jgi:excisionase family DNA binding protein
VPDEITTGEAGELLGLTRRQVTNLVSTGALTPLRTIRRWYLLDRAEVEHLARRREAARTVGAIR